MRLLNVSRPSFAHTVQLRGTIVMRLVVAWGGVQQDGRALADRETAGNV